MISAARRFLPLLAGVGVIVLAQQGLELLNLTHGADLATPAGRLGVVALVWTRGPVLLAADVFLIIAALQAGWNRLSAGLAMVHLLLGLAALAEVPLFLADSARIADSVGIAQLASFRITVFRILVALVVMAGGAVIAGASLVSSTVDVQ